jgi:hypothetical protein
MRWIPVALILLLTARPAAGQTAAAVVDSLAPVVADETVPEPTPGSIDIGSIDMWNTGVSPTMAVLMTPLFPGWGQLASDNSWKAALAYGAEMYFWTNILSRDRQAVRARDFARTFPVDDPNYARYNAVAEESWEQMRDFAWWSGGVLLIIALDAYVGAHLFNFDRDPVPVPDRWDDTFGPVGGTMPGAAGGPQLTVFQWRKKF